MSGSRCSILMEMMAISAQLSPKSYVHALSPGTYSPIPSTGKGGRKRGKDDTQMQHDTYTSLETIHSASIKFSFNISSDPRQIWTFRGSQRGKANPKCSDAFFVLFALEEEGRGAVAETHDSRSGSDTSSPARRVMRSSGI